MQEKMTKLLHMNTYTRNHWQFFQPSLIVDVEFSVIEACFDGSDPARHGRATTSTSGRKTPRRNIAKNTVPKHNTHHLFSFMCGAGTSRGL
ncbi:MAG: hypothetical protein GY874_18375 [Desulfobacteraceae bacterium]|nr:hypothetical protein [Desulfobacteraceae bacterium]